MGPNMPVSCESSDSAISSTIRDSLGNYNSITKASNLGLTKNQLSAALKQSLLKKIEYVESPPGFGYSIQESLKQKYTVLREEEKSTTQSVGGSSTQLTKSGHGTKIVGACLPSPKLVLYSRDRVQIGWGNSRKWSIGSGMVNLGNTCYLNSTLQALFHVPSFANWLHSDADHRNRCEDLSGSQSGCIICSMADVLHSTQTSLSPTKPQQVYSKLKQICRHLVHGHQEDAHEFLRYLMESMEKAFLSRYKGSKDFEQYTKETTPINQILGGYLRTSVKCLSCQYESVTFQHFEDLLLDIRKASTIEEALKHHFARERLEDMDYTCEACKKKVSATKQFSLERAPVALCIQLKRFSGINGKISKHINISQDIDFSQYSSKDVKNSQLKYRLVSMITHLGSTPQCGHYTAIGCCQDGSYYQFDDSSVRSMSVSSLVNTNPYIIFYELVPPETNSKRTETSTQFIGPLQPVMNNQLNKQPISTSMNGCVIKPIFGPASNGFGDNKKLLTISNNQIMSPKSFSVTASSSSSSVAKSPIVIKSSATSGNSPNETLSKNVEKNWIKTENSDSPSSPVLPAISLLPIKQQTSPKRTIETNKISNDASTKKSEDSRNSLSSDSESEIPSSPKVPALPSMPELKPNSPTTPKIDENAKSNGIKSPMTEDCRNVKRVLDSEKTPSLKLAVAVASSPAKSPSAIVQRIDETKKLVSPNHRESGESQQKAHSFNLQSPNNSRVTPNPFNKNNSNSVKNTKHKTNGHSNHVTYNQRNPKTTNGYVTTNKKSLVLVPYPCNEDSDSNNEDRKSPPIVKTKAGPFQVTKNTTNGNHWNASEQRLSWSNNSNPNGRVPSLSTWNGGASLLEEEVNSDQREHLKRKIEKDFDADLDIGRMKKKRRLGHTERDNPTYNPFQEHQNRKHESNHYRRYSNNNGNFHSSYRLHNNNKNDYNKSYNKRKY